VIAAEAAAVIESKSCGVLDAPLEPAIGLAEGETRWQRMRITQPGGCIALLPGNLSFSNFAMPCRASRPAGMSVATSSIIGH
jgi:hypothetical protein